MTEPLPDADPNPAALCLQLELERLRDALTGLSLTLQDYLFEMESVVGGSAAETARRAIEKIKHNATKNL